MPHLPTALLSSASPRALGRLWPNGVLVASTVNEQITLRPSSLVGCTSTQWCGQTHSCVTSQGCQEKGRASLRAFLIGMRKWSTACGPRMNAKLSRSHPRERAPPELGHQRALPTAKTSLSGSPPRGRTHTNERQL